MLSSPFQPWFGCRGVYEGKASGRSIDSLHVDLVCWGAIGVGDPAWHDLEVSCLWKVPLLGRGLLILARPLELPLLNVVLELFFLNQAEVDILGGLLEMCPWILGVQGLLHCRMRELGMDFFDPFLHVFLRDSMFEQEFLEWLVIGVEFGSSEDNARARRYMQSGDGRSLPECGSTPKAVPWARTWLVTRVTAEAWSCGKWATTPANSWLSWTGISVR